MRTVFISFLFLLAMCSASAAQSLTEVEKDLVNKFETARGFVRRGTGYDYDKFVEANNEFERSLLNYCQDPATLTYAFPDLSDEMAIVSSADKRFRVYSWDLGYGGTMRHHMSVFQYQGASGKTYGWEPAKTPDSGIGGLYRSVFSVPVDGGAIYLAESETIISTSDRVRELHALKVEGETLRPDIKVLQTSGGLQNEISLEYNYFSVKHDGDGNAKIFFFDPAHRSFRYEDVSKHGDSRPTGRFIVYKYDGKNFVRQR